MIKAAVQKILSMLPYSHRWNEFAQRWVTHSLILDADGEFRDKLEACQQFTKYYQTAAQRTIEGAKIVELGTGFFPIIPIGLYLRGASEIWSWDIVRLLRRDTFKRTLELFIQFKENDLLEEILPGVEPERLRQLYELYEIADQRAPHEMLERLNIHAVIGDVRKSGLAPQSVDFVFSHKVLQHLSREDLRSVLIEFRRLLKEEAVMCHHIGFRDQFASFDSSITPFNFLKYTKRQWKLIDNSIIPQNRLRIPDYRELLEQTNFCVTREDNLSGAQEDLRSVKLAQEFTNYSFDDLLVLTSWIVATPAPLNNSELSRNSRSSSRSGI